MLLPLPRPLPLPLILPLPRPLLLPLPLPLPRSYLGGESLPNVRWLGACLLDPTSPALPLSRISGPNRLDPTAEQLTPLELTGTQPAAGAGLGPGPGERSGGLERRASCPPGWGRGGRGRAAAQGHQGELVCPGLGFVRAAICGGALGLGEAALLGGPGCAMWGGGDGHGSQSGAREARVHAAAIEERSCRVGGGLLGVAVLAGQTPPPWAESRRPSRARPPTSRRAMTTTTRRRKARRRRR